MSGCGGLFNIYNCLPFPFPIYQQAAFAYSAIKNSKYLPYRIENSYRFKMVKNIQFNISEFLLINFNNISYWKFGKSPIVSRV